MSDCVRRALIAARVDLSNVAPERLEAPHNLDDLPGLCNDLGLVYVPPDSGGITFSCRGGVIIIRTTLTPQLHAEFVPDPSDVPESGVTPEGHEIVGMILIEGSWHRLPLT